MASITIPPQRPAKSAPVGQQIWTTWTMLLWFWNAYDKQINDILAQLAAITGGAGGAAGIQAGAVTVPSGATAVTVNHTLGAPNAVNVTPDGASAALVWGSGGYWISAKTNTSFILNLATAAPTGGIGFDWMVKTT